VFLRHSFRCGRVIPAVRDVSDSVSDLMSSLLSTSIAGIVSLQFRNVLYCICALVFDEFEFTLILLF